MKKTAQSLELERLKKNLEDVNEENSQLKETIAELQLKVYFIFYLFQFLV